MSWRENFLLATAIVIILPICFLFYNDLQKSGTFGGQDRKITEQATENLKIPADFRQISKKYNPKGPSNNPNLGSTYSSSLDIEAAKQKVLSSPGIICCDPKVVSSDSGGYSFFLDKTSPDGNRMNFQISVGKNREGTQLDIVTTLNLNN